MTKRLEMIEVSKRFGDKVVLDGVSLTVSRHQVVGLIGASGSGKSTLLRCVNRLVDYEGQILLDGVDVVDPPINELRKRVGIVFQSYNLFPHMTVLDNITLAPRRVHGIDRDQAEAKAHELLNLLGMGEFADSYPDRMSGGQQQRVAIVRALANNPDVLLLDEVTAALDPELIAGVLSVIRGLKEQGMTMVIVTHEMGFARDVADVVHFLDSGQIVESGPPQKVFSQPEHPRTRQFLQRIIEAGRL